MAGDARSGDDSKWTTVTVTKEMRNRLKSMKRGGESYSELLDRMIDQYEEPDQPVPDGGTDR